MKPKQPHGETQEERKVPRTQLWLNSRPNASTSLPATWMSHLRYGSPNPHQDRWAVHIALHNLQISELNKWLLLFKAPTFVMVCFTANNCNLPFHNLMPKNSIKKKLWWYTSKWLCTVSVFMFVSLRYSILYKKKQMKRVSYDLQKQKIKAIRQIGLNCLQPQIIKILL